MTVRRPTRVLRSPAEFMRPSRENLYHSCPTAVGMMSGYRVYILNGAGRIESVASLNALSDEEAIALVKARKLPQECEIWHADRQVARVHPPWDDQEPG